MAHAERSDPRARLAGAGFAILLNAAVLLAIAISVETVKLPPIRDDLITKVILQQDSDETPQVVEPTIKQRVLDELVLPPAVDFDDFDSRSTAIHDAARPKSDPGHLNPRPDYPAKSIALREEGVVLLAVLIGVDGRVKEARIEHSSGYARLDESALRTALRSYRFLPGTSNGVPVPMWLKIRIIFRLEDAGMP
jgi:protein TonB